MITTLYHLDLLRALACAAASTSASASETDGENASPDCAQLVKSGRFSEAISVCTEELTAAEGKGDETLLLHRAEAYVNENQANLALNDYETVLQKDASSLAAHLGKSEILKRQGKYIEAIKNLDSLTDKSATALREKIEKIKAKFEQAEKLMEEKAWEKANVALETLQLEDGVSLSSKIYTLRGQCLTWLGRYTDAIRMYQGRSTLELESSDTAYEVGKLYLALGNLEKGRKLIDDCARSNPEHRKALALRKKLKELSKTVEEADKMLIKQAVASLEEALKNSGSVDAGEPYYDAALASTLLSKPFELSILKLLCSKHIRLKQTDLALERCQRVLDLSATSASNANRNKNEEESAFLSLGEAYVMAEKYEEAMAVLKKAQRAFPRSQRVNEALQKTSADLRKSKQKDYYKIIGVSKDATESDIRRAYNKAARRWHPDKQPDESTKKEAESKMQDLNAALSILTDKKKRAQFDAGIDPEDPQGGASGFHHHGGGGHHGGFHGGFQGGFNFDDLFRQQRQHGGQQHHHRRHGGGGQRHHGGGGQRFEDFFKFDL